MIAIVGAGLTGLALSRELRRAGLETVVLEASDRVGGVIRSGRVDGHLLEWGPQRARLTPDLRVLLDELDLWPGTLTAEPRLPLYVFARGKLRGAPFSISELLATDLLSPLAKARLLAEPLTGPVRPRESVAEAFTRKLGREAYENLLGPLYGGLYASDPADMVVELSLERTLREMRIRRSLLLPLLMRRGRIDPPPALSFRNGLQTLPDALHAAAPDSVRLGHEVTGLTPTPEGFLVIAGGEEIAAEHVVLTIPAPAAAGVVHATDPDLAARLGSLRYNPLAVVHLLSDADLHGLGYQVALGETLVTRGVTFNHSLFGRDGVYTTFLGGARAPEVVQRSDEEIADQAVREFRRVTGFGASALSVDRVAMPAWDRSWDALQGVRLPPRLRIAANWWSRPGIAGRLAEARTLARTLARSD